MSLRLLITGGAGFVGRNICAVATERGHRVVSFDREQVGGVEARSLIGDIRDAEAVQEAASEADVILHCAAVVGPDPARKDPLLTVGVNVGGMATVLEAARGHGTPVVHLSTATLYGRRPDLETIAETDPTEAVGLYDATKLMAETLCDAYRKTWDTEAVSIRTGFVYGAAHSTGEYFVTSVLAGRPIAEPIGADHPCDFTYVADLARGMVLAAEAMPLPHPVYNVSGGRLHTRAELADVVRSLLPDAKIDLGPGVDPGRHLRGPCNIGRARADFDYGPQFDLREAISDWIERAVADR